MGEKTADRVEIPYPLDQEYSIVLDAAKAVPGGRPAAIRGPRGEAGYWSVIDLELHREDDTGAPWPREVIEWARRQEDDVAAFINRAFDGEEIP